MAEMIKNYFTSGNLFMDLLFIASGYASIIVLSPHLIRSMTTGVIKAKLGTFDIRLQQFKYIVMLIFTFLYLFLFVLGAFAIAWRRYLGY